jgi:GDPmannose 4,6-dehydratase
VAASRDVPGRALITGITGQDGSYLADLLLAEGTDVVGLARDVTRAATRVDPRVTLVAGDLGDPRSLRAAVEQVAPDELYHLAAPTFVPASWDDPTATVDAIASATATLLAAAVAAPRPPRVWVASSSEVFGDSGEHPQHERSPMRPRTPYGVAKLAAHGLVGAMRAHHGLFACSGLTYNHESPRRPEQFLPRKVTRGAAEIALGRRAELVLGSLDAVRDWSHAEDVMRAAVLALRHDEPGDYVVASGQGRTVRELVEAAFGHAGLDPDRHVRVDPALVRAPEPTPPVGDPSRARTVLGWTPRWSFEAMIAEMVDADLAALGGERR